MQGKNMGLIDIERRIFMKYFSNIHAIIYTIFLSIIIYFIFELNNYRWFTGNGFIIWSIFVIISLFIIFMNILYKNNKKGENNEKVDSKNR